MDVSPWFPPVENRIFMPLAAAPWCLGNTPENGMKMGINSIFFLFLSHFYAIISRDFSLEIFELTR
jgi:hypothetical protein